MCSSCLGTRLITSCGLIALGAATDDAANNENKKGNCHKKQSTPPRRDSQRLDRVNDVDKAEKGEQQSEYDEKSA